MADDENPEAYDLWGNPVYLRKGKRGRPPFQWTEENSNKVSMLLALGWGNDRIAGCVIDPRTGKAISVPTLKRYFRAELSERDRARDRLEARRFEVTCTQAFAGNVGALRLLNQMIEKNDLMGMKRKLDEQHGRGQAKSQQPVGKKEAALQAARESAAGTEWGADLDFGGQPVN